MLPLVLEWAGWIDRTYQVTGGVVISASEIFDMRRGVDEIALVIANLVFIVAAGTVALFIARRRMDAQRQMQIQAWHLRQLLPTARRWQTQPRDRRNIEG
jgi:hypothetical protein